MSNEPSEPMVLRLGNYLQKQPDGIMQQHRRDGLQGGPQGADGAKPEQPPRREQPQDSPVEMDQNNHHGGNNQNSPVEMNQNHLGELDRGNQNHLGELNRGNQNSTWETTK